MPAAPRVPDLPAPERLEQRTALHDQVAAVERLLGPSQVAALGGHPRTWSEPELAELWAEAAETSPTEAVNNLYVHVPFCKSICSFCNYDRLKPSHPDALRRWRDRVLGSIAVLAPAVKPLSFGALYFGGGTPSVLPARILEEVLEALDSAFSWRPRASRALELDPALVNPAKVSVLVKHRFQHFSFGVQTQRADINEAHNRGPQSPETIRRCLDLLPGPALATVAADILIGLAGVTPDDTLSDIEALLRHPRRPRVDVFHLTPTQDYVRSHFGGSRAAAAAALDQYDATFDRRLADLCAAWRYDLGSGGSHHARTLTPRTASWLLGPAHTRARMALYNSDLETLLARRRSGQPLGLRPWQASSYSQLATNVRAPLNLLGLGPSARSQIFGQAAVVGRPHAGGMGPTTYVGRDLDLLDELRTFVLFDIRDRGFVDDNDLRRLFGMGLADALPEATAVWVDRGFLEPAPGGWTARRGSPPEVAREALWALADPDLQRLVATRTGARSAGDRP